jgi:ABC-type transport system substrate-binding protein
VKVRNRGIFRFELMTPATDNGSRIAQYLQQAWKKVGIEADILSLENSTKIIRQLKGDYQASLTQLFEATHPSQLTAFLDPGATRDGDLSLVFSRLNDPELGTRIEDLLRGEPEVGVWRAATARIVERVNVMIPFIWLDHAPRNFFARPNVVNITQATLPDGRVAQDFVLGSHSLSQIWIKRPDGRGA